MALIVAVGTGGGGGTGVIGANSTAAGGGGGGSGAINKALIPLSYLPSVLYILAPMGNTFSGGTVMVGIKPENTVNSNILNTSAGGAGGNAAGGTAGIAGVAGGVNSLNNACLAGLGHSVYLGGQPGTAGGAAGAGTDLILPTTGLTVTGGAGGGGLPAAATAGTNGGSFTVPAAPSRFPSQAGGLGSATATNPAAPGNDGFGPVIPGLAYFYGGSGAASTHGTATGGGLVQARGGNGAIGCGGGGMGGALTGSSGAIQAIGGPGAVWIICW